VLLPLDGGRRTRFLCRSRSVTSPWRFTLGGRVAIIPADYVMVRDMLNGVKQRSEALSQQRIDLDPTTPPLLEHNADHEADQRKHHSVAHGAGQSPDKISYCRAEQSRQAEHAAGNQADAYNRYLASTSEAERRKRQRSPEEQMPGKKLNRHEQRRPFEAQQA
jgi:hypothetical protein